MVTEELKKPVVHDCVHSLSYNNSWSTIYSALFIAFLIAVTFTALPQTNKPPSNSPAEMMRQMRLKQLTMVPSEFGEKPTKEFPRVCAVIMDWPIQAATVTVVARATGDASVYTTGTFGVIGGIGHKAVRTAAIDCVKIAQQYYDAAVPTKEYPYPASSRVRFYLVGHDGVRVIDADLDVVKRDRASYSDLFIAAQRVVTELQMTTQKQKI
jgi:hypothetical protein